MPQIGRPLGRIMSHLDLHRHIRKKAARACGFLAAALPQSFWLCMNRSKVASVNRNQRFWSARNLL